MKNTIYKFLVVATLVGICAVLYWQTMVIKNNGLASKDSDCRIAGESFIKDKKDKSWNYEYVYYKTHYSDKLQTCLVSYLMIEKNITPETISTHYQLYEILDIYNDKGILEYSREPKLAPNNLYRL